MDVSNRKGPPARGEPPSMSLPGRPCAEALRAVGHGPYRHGAIPAACREPVACRVETDIENRVTQRRESPEVCPTINDWASTPVVPPSQASPRGLPSCYGPWPATTP